MLGVTPMNHPHHHRRRRGGPCAADDSVDDRETPPDVFEPLAAEFAFTLDVAAARHNAKCRRYFAIGPTAAYDWRQLDLFPPGFVGDPEAIALDGLRQNWGSKEVVWCNPPFSDIEPWVEKAHSCGATVVMLLPANRCEQPWWQNYIEPFRDDTPLNLFSPRLETRFLAGRRCFRSRGVAITNRTSRNPPFGIVIVIWDRRNLRHHD